MDKTTKALIVANRIVYLIFSIALVLGGIFALMARPTENTGKNIETMYIFGGIFLLLIGVGVFIALLVKIRN